MKILKYQKDKLFGLTLQVDIIHSRIYLQTVKPYINSYVQ